MDLPKSNIAARVNFPFVETPARLSNSMSFQESISSVNRGCTALYSARAFCSAFESKSLSEAPSTISADQSNVGLFSSNIAFKRSAVISTNEYSMRCHALL